MTRGRKPLTPAKKIGPDFVTRTPPDIAADQAVVIGMEQAVLDYSEVLVRTGWMQMANFNKKLNHLVLAREFHRVRESKKYKGLPYRDKDGKLRHVLDLEEYCQVFLGRAYQSVWEDAQNLTTLGDDLYEQALTLNLTSRNFRDIRGLQPDDQALVKEAIATKSREAVIEVMESLVVKHAKETKKKDKTIADLQSDLEATRKVTAKKDEKINEYEKRQQGLPAQLQELQIDCAKAGVEAVSAIQKFTEIRLATMDLLNGNERDRNDDTVIDSVGATHLQLLWYVQAWLVEEMEWAGNVFGGTKVEIRSRHANGPGLTYEEIAGIKIAGADEVIRVAGPRATQELSVKDAG